MSQYLIDTRIQLATCNRCDRYVWACQVSGLKVMADVSPVDLDGYRSALVDRRSAYRVITEAGRPARLQMLTAGHTGLQDMTIVVDHACGTKAMNATKMEPTEVPTSAPVRSTAVTGAQHPQAAPVGSQATTQPLSRARYVKSSRFDHGSYPLNRVNHRKQWLYRRCEICGEQMGYEEPFGIQYNDRWIYVWHDPCPVRET